MVWSDRVKLSLDAMVTRFERVLSVLPDGFAHGRNYQDRPIFHDEVVERQLGGEPSRSQK